MPIWVVSSSFWIECSYDCLIGFRRDKSSTQYGVQNFLGCCVLLIQEHSLRHPQSPLLAPTYGTGAHCLMQDIWFLTNKSLPFFNFHKFLVMSMHCRAKNIHQINQSSSPQWMVNTLFVYSLHHPVKSLPSDQSDLWKHMAQLGARARVFQMQSVL